MTDISLDELPSRSPWPERLLGLTNWSPSIRTIEKIQSEYDQDKYAKCLAFYDSSEPKKPGPEEVKVFEFDGVDREVCVSNSSKLLMMPLREARRRHYSLITETIRPELKDVSQVIELGCGYGFNLWMLSSLSSRRKFAGGEYSLNAVKLATKLYAQHQPPITVHQFDFYAAQYDFLEMCLSEGPSLVFTVHALEQLPSAAHVFDTLKKYRQHIATVFHFEPVYEFLDNSLMGLMRRRYTEINDYNRDLFSSLDARSDVRIIRADRGGFGLNPFNPTSIVQWEFV